MNITYSPALQEYIKKKGRTHLVVELADARTCCSGYSELTCDLVSDKAAAALEPKVVKRLDAPIGDVLVCARGLEYDDDISFDLGSFIGLKDIKVKGIRPWSI